MSRTEPRCHDTVYCDDGGRPTSHYTAMSWGRVGRLHCTLPPTSDRSWHTLPTFAGPLLPCVPALTCYVLFSTWEYSHCLALMRTFWEYSIIPGIAIVSCISVVGGCHLRTLPLFAAWFTGIEAEIFSWQVSTATNCPEARSSSYEKRSLGCIGEIDPWCDSLMSLSCQDAQDLSMVSTYLENLNTSCGLGKGGRPQGTVCPQIGHAQPRRLWHTLCCRGVWIQWVSPGDLDIEACKQVNAGAKKSLLLCRGSLEHVISIGIKLLRQAA
jgi:hypothetical protein